MRDGIVYRQGRTVHVSAGQKRAEGECNNCLCTLLGAVVPALLLFYLYQTESTFVLQQSAFSQIEAGGGVPSGADARPGGLVHVAAPRFEASASDPHFNLELDGGLKLSRNTEYCQWDETSTESCDTCTSTDDKGVKSSHSCNCVRTYHYIKAWRSRRMISIGFDQPANHHNPMRDPAPSASFVSGNCVASGFGIASSVLTNLRGPSRALAFSNNAQPIPPSFSGSIWGQLFGESSIRFQDIRALRQFEFSDARTHDNFIYTNTREGWFFSAYEAEAYMRLFKGFGQWMEGSMMDWQIGDLYDMVNGCTAGDVRVQYTIADPESLSAIGVLRSGDGAGVAAGVVEPFTASNGFVVAIAHAGLHSVDDMFENETTEQYYLCKWARAGALLGGLIWAALYEAKSSSKGDLSAEGAAARIGAMGVGLGLCLNAGTWIVVYGDAGGATTGGVTAAGFLSLGLWRSMGTAPRGKRY